MLRLSPLVFALTVAGCSQTGGGSEERRAIASAQPPVDPNRPIAAGGSAEMGDAITTSPNALKGKPVPRECSWAEVTVNTRTGEGRYQFLQFMTSETWMFWSRKDNGDNTVTWTFIRPKTPVHDADRLRPRPSEPQPRAPSGATERRP